MDKQSNVRFGVNEGFYLHRYLLTKEYGTCTPMKEFIDVQESSS